MPKKTKKQWVYAPGKPTVPDEIKAEVQKKADSLSETFLKPNFIKPPPADTQWNYIVDIYTKWYRNYLYFCSKYHCPDPTAITDYFEAKFARLEYVGNGKRPPPSVIVREACTPQKCQLSVNKIFETGLT